MHQVLFKHANEEEPFSSDFANRLSVGETLQSGTQSLIVTRGTGKEFDPETGRFVPVGPFTDVTSEFITGGASSVSGSKVIATLKKRASAGEQAAGTYMLKAEVVTSLARRLVDPWELEVTAEALP